jgi:hypothetical protein
MSDDSKNVLKITIKNWHQINIKLHVNPLVLITLYFKHLMIILTNNRWVIFGQ